MKSENDENVEFWKGVIFGDMSANNVEKIQPKPIECDDAISRKAAIRIAEQGQIQGYEWQFKELNKLPSVRPTYTDAEIQKMQELQFAEVEKAFELGKAEVETCEDTISRRAVLLYINKILNCGMGKKKSFEFIQKYVERLSPVIP